MVGERVSSSWGFEVRQGGFTAVKNGRHLAVRMLKHLIRVLAVTALMTIALHRFWSCLPWSDFVASAGLAHVTVVDGVRYCDFSRDRSAGSSIEWLYGLSANWKTEQFKEAVANRLFSLSVIKEDKDAPLSILNAVKFDIRSERSCVRIIAVAKSRMLAAECANGVADEIVKQLADENKRCKSIGCSQITRIRKRQQMLVRKIEDSLRGQNEDRTVNNKVRFTIDDLNRELEVLDQMKENEAKVSSVYAWNGVFERVDDAYENVHAIKPGFAVIGLISLFLSIMFETLWNLNRFFRVLQQ